ncbi:GrpB family protein [bacterium]|nr:MAG: GrpB family protein [bacterium]
MRRIEIVPYDSEWNDRFVGLGGAIREALGETARAIHHIGSTAVPGLGAKDVIDLQVTVASLDTPIEGPLTSLGYAEVVGLADHLPPGTTLAPDELAKRYFRHEEPPTHLHVRAEGQFNTRYALLCRDYLRAHGLAASAYGEIKRELARMFPLDADSYYAVKDPVFDLIMVGAEAWVRETGWTIPPSDA